MVAGYLPVIILALEGEHTGENAGILNNISTAIYQYSGLMSGTYHNNRIRHPASSIKINKIFGLFTIKYHPPVIDAINF